jgi:hypothetical protein
VVECIGDHVRLLDDLPNGATLAQEIVAGLVLPITEIITIENDKLHSIFEAKPVETVATDFEAKPLTNCLPWF